MPKQGEIDYVRRLVPAEVVHAVNKPFSDPHCGQYLVELGTILDLLPEPPARVLDVGCGTGWTSCFLARRGYRVTGVDIAADMIHHANLNKTSYAANHLDFRVCDYEDLDFVEEFDGAVFFDSLHHALSEEDALRSVYRALKPGGVCITSEPGRGHARSEHAVNAIARFNVTERDMPPRRIIRAATRAGFRVCKTYPQARQLHMWIYGRSETKLWRRLLKSHPLLKGLALALWMAMNKRDKGLVYLVK